MFHVIGACLSKKRRSRRRGLEDAAVDKKISIQMESRLAEFQ